jgi:hypothetical protein
MYVQRLSRAEIRVQLVVLAITMCMLLTQAIPMLAKAFEVENPIQHRLMNLCGGLLFAGTLGCLLVGLYRWRKQGQGYRAGFLTHKSLVFKGAGQPFVVVKRGDVVGFIPRRYALILRDGRKIPIHADFWSVISPHPERLTRELFEHWWPEVTLETVRAAQREANRLPERLWLAVFYVAGIAVTFALVLALVLDSLLIPALFLIAIFVLGFGLYFRNAWSVAFVYPLPPARQIQSVAHDITTANPL